MPSQTRSWNEILFRIQSPRNPSAFTQRYLPPSLWLFERSGGAPVPYKRDFIPDSIPTKSKYVTATVIPSPSLNLSLAVVTQYRTNVTSSLIQFRQSRSTSIPLLDFWAGLTGWAVEETLFHTNAISSLIQSRRSRSMCYTDPVAVLLTLIFVVNQRWSPCTL